MISHCKGVRVKGVKVMRGKKHSFETKEKVRALVASGFTVKEVHGFTGVSENTIYDWLNGDFLTDDEFKKVRDENKKRIINKSWDAVLSAIDVMKSKIERALRAEEAASSIIDKLLKGKDLDELQKARLKLELASSVTLGDVTRSYGVMIDKISLLSGDPTANLNLSGLKFEDL